MEREVVAEIAIIPVGTGDAGLSSHIAACIKLLQDRQDLSYQLTATGTILQGSLQKVLEVTGQMHEIPFTRGVSRVVTILKIDDRRDKKATISGKVQSVLESHLLTEA